MSPTELQEITEKYVGEKRVPFVLHEFHLATRVIQSLLEEIGERDRTLADMKREDRNAYSRGYDAGVRRTRKEMVGSR